MRGSTSPGPRRTRPPARSFSRTSCGLSLHRAVGGPVRMTLRHGLDPLRVHSPGRLRGSPQPDASRPSAVAPAAEDGAHAEADTPRRPADARCPRAGGRAGRRGLAAPAVRRRGHPLGDPRPGAGSAVAADRRPVGLPAQRRHRAEGAPARGGLPGRSARHPGRSVRVGGGRARALRLASDPGHRAAGDARASDASLRQQGSHGAGARTTAPVGTCPAPEQRWPRSGAPCGPFPTGRPVCC